jgi:site-specific recombinase XerC
MLSKAFNLARLCKWTKENPRELVKHENEDNENIGQCLFEDKEQGPLELCRLHCNGQLVDMVIVAVNTGLRERSTQNAMGEGYFQAGSMTVIQKRQSHQDLCHEQDNIQSTEREGNGKGVFPGMSFVTSSDTPFIARNVYRPFKKACRKAGLPSFRFHDLRRTVGTRLAQAGHDLYAIAKGLGHKK